MISLPPIVLLATVVTVGAGLVTDLRSRTVPNALSMGSLVAGIIERVVSGALDSGGPGAASGLIASLLGALVVSLFPVIMFFRKELGGGDVKLFAALGAWCGSRLALNIEIDAFLCFYVTYFPVRFLLGTRLPRERSSSLDSRPPQPVSTPQHLGSTRKTLPFVPWIFAAYVYVVLISEVGQ